MTDGVDGRELSTSTPCGNMFDTEFHTGVFFTSYLNLTEKNIVLF